MYRTYFLPRNENDVSLTVDRNFKLERRKTHADNFITNQTAIFNLHATFKLPFQRYQCYSCKHRIKVMSNYYDHHTANHDNSENDSLWDGKFASSKYFVHNVQHDAMCHK